MSENKKVDSSAEELGKRASQLPESTQVAIITVLPNIVNGAFWGFTTVKEMQKDAEALKTDKNITLRKIGKKDDVIVEVDPNYLVKAVSLVGGDAVISKSTVERMKDGIARGIADIEKFLIHKGKKGNFEGLIGVYCVNDTTSITYKGVSYPSFRVPLARVLQACNKYKYMVEVGGKYVTPQQAMQSGQALFDSVILSPTKTGAFIKIKSVGTEEFYKEEDAKIKKLAK